MTKDDSYHEKRGNGFIYSPEKEIYKTDELRYALEELHKYHEDVICIRDNPERLIEKLEFLDNVIEFAYGFLSKAIDPLKRYTDIEDLDPVQKELRKLSGSKFHDKGSKKGQEFENAILSYNASDQQKKEICDNVRNLILAILSNSRR